MFLSFEIMLLPYVSGVPARAGDTRKKMHIASFFA
jgi:hypothetical protein